MVPFPCDHGWPFLGKRASLAMCVCVGQETIETKSSAYPIIDPFNDSMRGPQQKQGTKKRNKKHTSNTNTSVSIHPSLFFFFFFFLQGDRYQSEDASERSEQRTPRELDQPQRFPRLTGRTRKRAPGCVFVCVWVTRATGPGVHRRRRAGGRASERGWRVTSPFTSREGAPPTSSIPPYTTPY